MIDLQFVIYLTLRYLERLWWRKDDLHAKLFVLRPDPLDVPQSLRLFMIRNKWNMFTSIPTSNWLGPLKELEYAARVGNVSLCKEILQEPVCKLLINTSLDMQINHSDTTINMFPTHHQKIITVFFKNTRVSPMRSAVLFNQVEVVKLFVEECKPREVELKILLQVATVMDRLEVIKVLFPLVHDAGTVLLDHLEYVRDVKVLEWLLNEIQPEYETRTYICSGNPYYGTCSSHPDHLGSCKYEIYGMPFRMKIPIPIIPKSVAQIITKTVYYEMKRWQISWAFLIEELLVNLGMEIPHGSVTGFMQRHRVLMKCSGNHVEVKRRFAVFLMRIASMTGIKKHIELAHELIPLNEFPDSFIKDYLDTAANYGHADIVIAIMVHANVDNKDNNVDYFIKFTLRVYVPFTRCFWLAKHAFYDKPDAVDILIDWYNKIRVAMASNLEFTNIMLEYAKLSIRIIGYMGKDAPFRITTDGRLAPMKGLDYLMGCYQKTGPDHKNFISRKDFSVPEDYQCPVCYTTLAELHESSLPLALITECKHYYCVKCVIDQENCPMCRVKLHFTDEQKVIYAV